MLDIVTVDDKRFLFLEDIDGNDAPIFVGKVVTAINRGLVPGFSAFNEQEAATADEILRDAEHHHRFRMMHHPDARHNYAFEGQIEKRMHNLRKRLGLETHREHYKCCPYLKPHHTAERVGL